MRGEGLGLGGGKAASASLEIWFLRAETQSTIRIQLYILIVMKAWINMTSSFVWGAFCYGSGSICV